ncbi:tetratricopeptide repeat protein [Elusimicrobiota bacterium]
MTNDRGDLMVSIKKTASLLGLMCALLMSGVALDAKGKNLGKRSRKFRDKGAFQMELGKYKEAIPLYEKAVKKEPDWMWNHYLLGIAHFAVENSGANKDYSHAIEAFGKSVKLSPSSWAAAHIWLRDIPVSCRAQ